jgi:isopenicillin N synthase-like dioxygenase
MPKEFLELDLGVFEAATGKARDALEGQVDQICRETGFLAIAGHGVPPAVIDAIWAQTTAFFDRPIDEKFKAHALYPGYLYGYLGPKSEALAKYKGVETPPDLKESFNVGPLSVPDGLIDETALTFYYAQTIWPEGRPEFRPA